MKINREETYRLIWSQLQNSKFKEIYFNLLLERYQKRERLVNIFLVVITSSSVSAWAIWKLQVLEIIWASLVAFSQILILIKPYLSYTKNIKELHEKSYLLQMLNLEYEKLWLSFKFEKITPENAFEEVFKLKQSLTEKLNFSEDLIMSEDEKLYQKSKEKLGTFLKVNYNVKEKSDTKTDTNGKDQ